MPSTLTLDGKFYYMFYILIVTKSTVGLTGTLDIEQVICLTLTLANVPENLLSGEPVYQVWQLQESCQNTLSRNHLVYIQTDRQTYKCKKIFPQSSMGKGGLKNLHINCNWWLNPQLQPYLSVNLLYTVCYREKKPWTLYKSKTIFKSRHDKTINQYQMDSRKC